MGSPDTQPSNQRAPKGFRQNGVQKYHPFGLPFTIVTRRLQGDTLVWHYPRFGEVRMERVCRKPEEHRGVSCGGRASPSRERVTAASRGPNITGRTFHLRRNST